MFDFFHSNWFNIIVENGVRPKFIFIYNSLWLDMDVGGDGYLYIKTSGKHYGFVTHTPKYGSCSATIMSVGDILDEVKDSGVDLNALNPAWAKLMREYGRME